MRYSTGDSLVYILAWSFSGRTIAATFHQHCFVWAVFVTYFTGVFSMRLFQKKFWCDFSQGFSLRPFLKVPILRLFTGVFLFIFYRGLFSVHSFAWTISMDSLAVLFSMPVFAAQLFMAYPGSFFRALIFSEFLHELFCRTFSPRPLSFTGLLLH